MLGCARNPDEKTSHRLLFVAIVITSWPWKKYEPLSGAKSIKTPNIDMSITINSIEAFPIKMFTVHIFFFNQEQTFKTWRNKDYGNNGISLFTETFFTYFPLSEEEYTTC